jgi:hypothetical protein
MKIIIDCESLDKTWDDNKPFKKINGEGDNLEIIPLDDKTIILNHKYTAYRVAISDLLVILNMLSDVQNSNFMKSGSLDEIE